MRWRYIQAIEAGIGENFQDVAAKDELPGCSFDGNLPDADGAHNHTVGGIGDGGASGFNKA